MSEVLERKFSVIVNDTEKQHPPEVTEIKGGTHLDLYKRDCTKLMANLATAIMDDEVVGLAVITIGPDLDATASAFTSACADNVTATIGGLAILNQRLLEECLVDT